MVRALAMILFANSAVTAFCLALMAVMYATGDLPFGLKPLYRYEDKIAGNKLNRQNEVKEQKRSPEEEELHNLVPERANEKIIADFYEDLKHDRQKLLLDKKNFVQEKKSLQNISARFKALEENLVKKQQELEKLLIRITDEEQANVKKISKLLVTMEGVNAVKVLLQQDNKMIARVLYMMDDKKAGAFISEIINNPAGKERMKKIYELMHKLTLKKLSAGEA